MSVDAEDRATAAFIGEYEALCRKHGRMVVQVYYEDQYSPFAVAKLRGDDDRTLARQLDEMRLGHTRTVHQWDEGDGEWVE